MPKTIAFRPTEKHNEAIKDLLKSKQAKNKSEAVNQLIAKGLESPEPPKHEPRLEQTITGTLIKCELRTVPVPYDNPFTLWKAPVDSSTCLSCSKYPCEEWENVESYERVTEAKGVRD